MTGAPGASEEELTVVFCRLLFDLLPPPDFDGWGDTAGDAWAAAGAWDVYFLRPAAGDQFRVEKET